MIELQEAVRRLKINEGVVLSLYICKSGYPTIGIGRNILTNPLTDEERKVCGNYEKGITPNMAEYLCRNDIKKFTLLLKSNIPLFNKLDDERQFVLLDMCFNLGLQGLLKFKNMLYDLTIGNYRGASKELLNSRYAQQVGNRAKRNAYTLEFGKWKDLI